MSKARDIRELVAEQSSSTAERRALEAVADALEESLAEDVPYRRQFKADLRRKVMAQARKRISPPWYRRTATWGITAGVAAAAAILVVGLNLWQTTPGRLGSQPPANVEPGPPGPPLDVNPVHTAQQPSTLPGVILADQLLAPGQPGPESLVDVDVTKGLRVYAAKASSDEATFTRMAQGLGFTAQPRKLTEGYSVDEGARSLKLMPDGRVTYTDFSLPVPAEAVDADGALATARRFLEQAGLPIPSLDPNVADERTDGRRQFVVSYTPRQDRRPIINGRTVVRVSEHGSVSAAEAFTHTVYDSSWVYKVSAPSDAVKAAEKQGSGRFDSVDLVYVRSGDSQGVLYLQPFWRVFGTHSAGQRMVRFIPAVASGK